MIGFSLSTCRSVKENPINSPLEDLVSFIIQESFPENRDVCLNQNSVSFEFKFPDSFTERDSTLLKEEIAIIEKEFKSAPINWKETIRTSYKSKRSAGCLFLSKPIFLRNNQLAFVYAFQVGTTFYRLYEKQRCGWKLKEILITEME